MTKNKVINYTLESEPINVLGTFEVEPIPTFKELWDKTTVTINGKKLTGIAKQKHLHKKDKELLAYVDSLIQLHGTLKV